MRTFIPIVIVIRVLDPIVRAIAGVYRAEQTEDHRLAEQVKQAAADDEAALYVLYSQSAEKQDYVLKTVRYIAAALGIYTDELNAAANSGRGCE